MHDDKNDIEKPNYQLIFFLFLLISVNFFYAYKGFDGKHLPIYTVLIVTCCWMATGWNWIRSLYAKNYILFLLTTLSFTISSYYSAISGFGYSVFFFIGLILLVSFSSTDRYQSRIVKFYVWFATLYVIVTLLLIFYPSLVNSFSWFYNASRLASVSDISIAKGPSGLAGLSSANGFFISILLGFLFIQFLYAPKRKIFTFILYFITFATMVATKRRGILVGNIVASLVLLFFYLQKSRAWMESIAVVFVLGVSFYMISNYTPLLNELYSKNEELIKEGDITSGRIDLYEYAWELYEQKPFFGHGLLAYNQLRQDYFVDDKADLSAHNTYIQMFAEAGIIGAVLFIGCLLLVLYQTLAALRRTSLPDDSSGKNQLILLSLYVQILFLVFGGTDTNTDMYQMLYTYFLFSSIALYYYNFHEKEQ